jgi:proline dehydrogenase
VIERAIGHLGLRPPRPLVRRLAKRHIAGRAVADACRLVRKLAREGKLAAVGPLGEDSGDADTAQRYAAEAKNALPALAALEAGTALSLKLSALGLGFDQEFCFERLQALVGEAAARGVTVFIDMERSAATGATIALYRRLREQSLDNVVLALQARLRRTLADIRDLAPLAPAISLCKGAYGEPAELAYSDPEELGRSFLSGLAELVSSASFIGVATSDRALVSEARRSLAQAGFERYELQLLFGSTGGLDDELARAGEPVRIYVPYGESWYDYTLRRLPGQGESR